MAKTIEPKLMKIGEYLKLEEDAEFVIPEYQRAYSWGIDRCDKLWSDITQYVENKEKDAYFFGTVILNCQDNDEKLLLIDGQQRTTTFLLLLKAFLLSINQAILDTQDSEDSRELNRKFRDRRKSIMSILYRVDTDEIADEVDNDSDKRFFNSNASLIINHSISEDHKDDFSKILCASTFEEAEYNVDKIERKQKDNKYSNFFRNFKFFYEKINELGESKLNEISKAFVEKCEVICIRSWNIDQAIVMFNSLNSDGLPLSDSDIILSKLYGEADDKDKFNRSWKVFKSYVEDLEKKEFASIDSILMQYMYYIRTRNGETSTADGKTANVTVPGLRRYFTDINKDAIADPDTFVEKLTKLAKSWNMVVDYPCVQVLSKLNDNAKLFLASFFYRFENEVTEADVKELVESLMKLFAILEIEDMGYSSSKFKSFLFLEEIKIANPKVTVEEIKNDFNSHITSNWTPEEVKQKINEYDKGVLVYLNEYLFAKENNLPFDLSEKYDIEHIMPASGKNIQTIRIDANMNEEEFRNTVNKIGNKILLESAINRSISNEWFKTKVSTRLADKSGYIDSRYPIAKALVEKYRNSDKKLWTKEDIEAATAKASERITNFIFC